MSVHGMRTIIIGRTRTTFNKMLRIQTLAALNAIAFIESLSTKYTLLSTIVSLLNTNREKRSNTLCLSTAVLAAEFSRYLSLTCYFSSWIISLTHRAIPNPKSRCPRWLPFSHRSWRTLPWSCLDGYPWCISTRSPLPLYRKTQSTPFRMFLIEY